MEYPLISRVAANIANVLSALPGSPDSPLFPEVRTVCLSSYEHLFNFLPDLRFMPAALVCVGGAEYREANAWRELEVAVIVIDALNTGDNQAEAPYAMLDAVSAALTGDTPGQPLAIDNVNYLLDDFRSLKLDNSHVAWVFTLNAVASCQI